MKETKMLTRKLAFAVLGAAMMTGALAHAPEKGKNGGQQVDAGNYHVEAVAKGNTLNVYITDHSETPVSTKGFKGTAVLIVKGKPAQISLAARGDNILAGTSPVELAAPIRGAIQITNNEGQTVQAKF
jgi:redox-sensitive bicupin YhaK (pirin superfamily)